MTHPSVHMDTRDAFPVSDAFPVTPCISDPDYVPELGSKRVCPYLRACEYAYVFVTPSLYIVAIWR